MGPFWFLLIAYWVVFLTADDFVLESLIILAAGLLAVLGFYLRRKIRQIICRKWTFRLEQKERRQPDEPWQQRENEPNPVGDWLSREAESEDE